MKIFHLADLHIGKKLNNVSLIEDQRYLLDQVLAALVEKKPDVMVLAGDIYDRRNPPIEGINLLDDFLSQVILVHKVPVIAIGGNHDSGERLGFANGILARAGLHLQGRLALPVPKVCLSDEWGKVCFHLLPYADLPTIRYEMGGEEVEDYQEAMALVLAKIGEEMDPADRHVLLAHGVVMGSSPLMHSESERDLTIGGTEYWKSELLGDFDYVALGHLHHSQSAGLDHVRYAGSLMKYSFSEEKQVKSLLMVDLAQKGQLSYEAIPLRPLREMRTIKGTLAELMDSEKRVFEGDFIRAVLTDVGEVLEPMATLKSVYPHILSLERAHFAQSMVLGDALGSAHPEDQTPEALFIQFYWQMTNESISKEALAILEPVFKSVEAVE